MAVADPRVTRAADAGLVERLRTGDEHAVEELVNRYAGLVYRVALRITRTAADAEEVTWDVMQTVWRKIAAFRGEAALSSWIYRIAANAAYEKIRARKAPTVPLEEVFHRHDPTASGVADSSDWSTSCDDPLVQAELRAVLEDGIAALPVDYRTALVLRDVEGLSNAEVADVLGVRLAAVKSRVHRARLALRGRLAGYFATRRSR
ncbi:MAG: sigma-70 family RNA polymerase sigma factor [candidate division NC10 bacterium]|nr:sigma-70 family RNA polymerase sigma factor [candidate division NC10 bacterium]